MLKEMCQPLNKKGDTVSCTLGEKKKERKEKPALWSYLKYALDLPNGPRELFMLLLIRDHTPYVIK